MAITVLLADDHPVFRKGLAFLLAEETDIQMVGEAADGQAAIEMAKGCPILADGGSVEVAETFDP